MQDNELLASFEPRLAGYVLVMAFDDLEELLLEQERIQANHRQERDAEGAMLPQVETLWMGQSQVGQRSLMADEIQLLGLIASTAGLKEIEEARRGWARSRMQASAMLESKRGVSLAWAPSTEQMDMLEKYALEVLEPNPAGNGEGSPRIKLHLAREGFNWYCKDHDRPDLQFVGTAGGRAFSAVLQTMFPDDAAVRRGEGNNPYMHGLRRKSGVNPKYFKRS